jgi:tRNA (guanine-N7-)-methyltransferase
VRNRQHVNPLGLSYTEYRDVVPELDGARPVEVEIGCADAKFLFDRAEGDPARQYFGLEIRNWLVDQVNDRADTAGLPVRAMVCNANNHLRTVFADASVDIVHVLFPDPWFKRRQRKRRLMSPELVEDIHAILKPGGTLHFASDVWDLVLDALYEFEVRDDLFANVAGAWTFHRDHNPFRARSWREQNCLDTGLPFWRMVYERVG